MSNKCLDCNSFPVPKLSKFFMTRQYYFFGVAELALTIRNYLIASYQKYGYFFMIYTYAVKSASVRLGEKKRYCRRYEQVR